MGLPNSGKSTYLNSILKTKLSIVSSKPQTTRKRVLGIYSDEDSQIVFFDNPGILKPRYELQKKLMEYVATSLSEADVLIILLDIEACLKRNKHLPEIFLEQIKNLSKPAILLLNKIDQLSDIKLVLPIISQYSQTGIFNDIIPISALKKNSSFDSIKIIKKYLPEAPFYYDSELLSTQPERFFVSEIIREQVFKLYKEELPYSTEVYISEFKERTAGKWFISADIIIERSSQKGIIIGAGGVKLKELGEKARKEIESHLEMSVYLELFVKVRENWREDKNRLREMGY